MALIALAVTLGFAACGSQPATPTNTAPANKPAATNDNKPNTPPTNSNAAPAADNKPAANSNAAAPTSTDKPGENKNAAPAATDGAKKN